MKNISLRKIEREDIKYFAKWWKDHELIALTSGNFDELSDEQIKSYFEEMIDSKSDYYFMIDCDDITVGSISLIKYKDNSYETQVVIGEKEYWSMGIGSEAISQLTKKAEKLKIKDIFLEVRPDNKRAINAYKKVGFREIELKKYPNNPNLKEVIVMKYHQ